MKLHALAANFAYYALSVRFLYIDARARALFLPALDLVHTRNFAGWCERVREKALALRLRA